MNFIRGKVEKKGEQGNQQNRGVMWAGYSAIHSINICLTISYVSGAIWGIENANVVILQGLTDQKREKEV